MGKGTFVPLVVAAATSLSCGGRQHAQGGGDDAVQIAGVVKSYEPLGIKSDAKMPNKAVILGTDDHDGSTVLPLAAVTTKASVDALWVKLGSAGGGFTPVKLSTSPNRDGSVRVGIFEEMAGGTGPAWRAGVWVSAFVAASTLGKDLTDFTFSASSGGYIDGPSASGLMAGGFLASMLASPVDDTATMTGTINPDGTIGPVGGVPEKFLGAIAKGKKHLGYPLGMRFAKAEADGKMIDLVQLAKDHGAEAVEITDVRDAYKLLTHKALPQPVPLSEAEMALDDVTKKALDDTYKIVQKKLGERWPQLLQLGQAGQLPEVITSAIKTAQDKATRADKLHAQGIAGAAVTNLMAAWFYTLFATDMYAIVDAVRSHKAAGALDRARSMSALADRGRAVFDKIGAIKPATLGAHLQMVSAFQMALHAWGFTIYATEVGKSLSGMLDAAQSAGGAEVGIDELVGAVLPALALADRAVVELELAELELSFMTDKSVNYRCSIPNVKRLSTSYASASVAGLAYFETLFVQPYAEQVGVTESMVKEKMLAAEPDYLVANVTSHLDQANGLPSELKTSWGDGSVGWALMSLAASELAYSTSSQLIAKYYSLGVSQGADGRADSVVHDKAFSTMLASAERAARSSARAARIATGSIPVQTKLAYQLAVVERDGDVSDKLDALGAFWQASAYAQTAVALARN